MDDPFSDRSTLFLRETTALHAVEEVSSGNELHHDPGSVLFLERFDEFDYIFLQRGVHVKCRYQVPNV
jgi:hypothetical protein